jgi:hypothetical protein
MEVWQAIPPEQRVPRDVDLHLAVIDAKETHSLVFPCRRQGYEWVNARTGETVDVHPTHWCAWQEGN